MALSVQHLRDKTQTASEMSRLVDCYAGDLQSFDVNGVSLAETPLPIMYEAIKRVPYRRDDRGIEIVTRPYLLLSAPFRGWDCKKKAIVIASWLKLHDIPYRFVAVSRRADREIHHVIVQAYIDDEWVDIDATYPHNQLFERQQWTKIEPLAGDGRASDQPVLVSLSGGGDPGAELTDQFVSTVARVDPEYLGDGVSAVVALVTAIVAAVASVTVGIISAVAQRKSDERRAKTEAETVQSYADIQAEQQQFQAEQARLAREALEAKQEKQYDMIKKWIIPGAIGVAGLMYFTR